ncbi:hypothetical protein Tco_0613085 [Tanacetum coccineum]
MDSESQSQNVETRKKMVPKRKNKFAAKKQGEAETQVDDAQVHTEVQANVGGAQSQTQASVVQAIYSSTQPTSPKWTKNKIAASRLMGSP